MIHPLAGLLTATLISWAVFSTPAAAQQCTDRAGVVDHLSQRYAEKPVVMGITQAGNVLEILVSKDGQSWTVIVTGTTGLACMIAAGENWRDLPTTPQGTGT